jgi:hypothetical protein
LSPLYNIFQSSSVSENAQHDEPQKKKSSAARETTESESESEKNKATTSNQETFNL